MRTYRKPITVHLTARHISAAAEQEARIRYWYRRLARRLARCGAAEGEPAEAGAEPAQFSIHLPTVPFFTSL